MHLCCSVHPGASSGACALLGSQRLQGLLGMRLRLRQRDTASVRLPWNGCRAEQCCMTGFYSAVTGTCGDARPLQVRAMQNRK